MDNREYQRMRQYEDDYWWYHGLRGLTIASIAKYCVEPRPLLLDAGCGTGGELSWLRDHLPNVVATGVDLVPEAIRSTRQRGFRDLACASVMGLPFPDGTFDIVTSMDVLYIQGVDDVAALREMRRVTRPDGLLVLNLPAFEFLRGGHDVAVRTRHRYRRSEVHALLLENGYRVETLSYWNMLMLPVVALARWMSRSSPPGDAASDFRRIPGWASEALKGLIRTEVKAVQRFSLPAGVSIFAVARKADI